MRCSILLLLLFFSPFFKLAAQYYSLNIDLPETNGDLGASIWDMGDGLMIQNGAICDGMDCFIVVKTDYSGNVQWHKITEGYKCPRSDADAMIQKGEHFYAVLKDNEIVEERVKVVKLDAQGEWLDEWDFGAGIEGERPLLMSQFGDGFFLSNVAYDGPDGLNWLQYFDSNMINIHNVFFPDEAPYWFIGVNDVIETSDSNLVVTNTVGLDDGLVTKINGQGEVLWQNRLKGHYVSQLEVLQLDNGNIAASWYGRDTGIIWPFGDDSPKILGLSPQGDSLWSNLLASDGSFSNYLLSMVKARNGDIIGMGQYFIQIEEPWDLIHTGWIFRMSQEGELLWQRLIFDERAQGTLYYQYFKHAVELENGDWVFTGFFGDSSPTSNLESKIWLVRTDANGCLLPDCDHNIQLVSDTGVYILTDAAFVEKIVPESDFQLFPNPVREEIHLQFAQPLPDNSQAFIFNQLGQLVEQKDVSQQQSFIWPIEGLQGGLYFMVAQTPDGRGWKKRFLVMD
ncbi:MAG TPA: T9SS type A sorting domain-containing protein [Saprospiraceae bacterium]|nr:T9SS type A sorting domain-containing protein [Saprospiraceae bacterium]HMQ82252.1 T9SS type A sorting domain-containing protein [Saprospiraceae bacterium]